MALERGLRPGNPPPRVVSRFVRLQDVPVRTTYVGLLCLWPS